MSDDMNGASQIASDSFNSQPISNDMGPLAITSDPGSFSGPYTNQTTQPISASQASGVVSGFGKGIASGAKNNQLPQYHIPSVDNSYHALFSTEPMRAPAAQMAPIPQSQPAIPMMAQPAPMPMTQPMPQLAMSDYDAKKNIRPIRKDIDVFLKQVYSNVVNKRK